MPNVMTQREGGVDSQYVTRFGFFAPRGTPEPVIAKFAAALAESVKDPAYVEQMRRMYNDVVFIAPAPYAISLVAEDQGYAKLIRDLKIKAQ
jgi:tripartite-type tricarboxylate transporter receptor subunit TctC